MFLLDTNVISELRKAAAGKADQHVVLWSERVETASLYVSVITIMELETGILRMERRDAGQGRLLRAWFESRVLPAFDERILAADLFVARRCARLHVPDPRSDRDALIAATALVHSLTVVTRNTADFEPMGVAVIDPWASA